ncbi:hypothetical protein KJ596_00980 [Patescibacteria group bacterium]|nr:hypothetical protein [Patescibacteria group bacterium]MBU1868800.1 hypothetical protein [Patescibacteria group bacterium]
MYNWNTDTTRLKLDVPAYEKWQLEQMINYGLNNNKLPKNKLLRYWPDLNIDPDKKRYLELILWKTE